MEVQDEYERLMEEFDSRQSNLAYDDINQQPVTDGYEPEELIPPVLGSSWHKLRGMIDPIEWDWPGWLPRGFLTLLASEPGMGKSLLALRIAASYIDGRSLPDGTPFNGFPGWVLWCEGEGSQAVNVARAEAWGLPLTSIVTPLSNPFHSFRLDDDDHLMKLARLCRLPDVLLVVMDSLSSLVGGATGSGPSNSVIQGIPTAASYLSELARGTGKPILLTHHLRKRTAVDPKGAIHLDRIRGTSKIAQAARVVWTLDSPNPHDPDHRRLAVAKNNLMPLSDPLGMRIDGSRLVFGEPPVAVGGRVVDEAAVFLRGFMGEGVFSASEVLEAGLAAGFSVGALKRAKRMLGVKSRRIEGGKGWRWELEK